MTQAPIAVVTVTYRSAGDVPGFLESVAAAGGVETVLVVDNPSEQSDEIERLARAGGAETLRLPTNVGYGAAMDAGVAQLDDRYEFVIIANPDVRFHEGSVTQLLDTLTRNPEVGLVGPRILNVDGTTYPSARRIPSLRAGTGHALFSRSWPDNPWTRLYRQDDAPSDEVRDVGWLSGACLAVRRTAFEAVEGFDPGYFMYFEDVDLGYRLGRAGWTNRYDPAAVVTHIGATSTSGESARMLREHHRSAARFLSKKYRGWYLAPLRGALRVGLAVRARWLTRGWREPNAR